MLPIDAFLTEITLNVNKNVKKKKKKEMCSLLPIIHPAVWNMGMKAGVQTSTSHYKKAQ